ncbi:MAG: DUF1549 domain-containing protein [Planctomycetaceae bacterium]|nr:DUF1549 domain-containing protein [Planctomycetaceae bacterium]
MRVLFPVLAAIAVLTFGRLAADDRTQKPQPSAEDVKFFELHIRPLLAEHCYSCHSDEKQKGQLRVDSPASLLTGGESGPAIVEGKPEESLLIQAVRYESFEMPPNGKLPEESIRLLEEWVRRGAPWPGGEHVPAVAKEKKGFTDDDRAWWALQPVADVKSPEVDDASKAWVKNEIDQFIAAAMVKEGLSPAPEADRLTLIRRLSFDLIGLPPTPEQISEFLNDSSPDAWEKLVDRMLASPQYGERWARHWLDVVRYADSDGYRIDHYRPDSWRYRDYVIRSLNQDKPYDRFVQEQLAGDELFPGNPDALIATGYLRHWIYEYNNRDAKGQWDIILNEVTDTTGDVFLGVGMQCARCHDHKFDPILQKDYYRLRAFFEAIRPMDKTVIAPTAEQQAWRDQMTKWEEATADVRARIAEIESRWRKIAREDAISKFPADIQKILQTEFQTLSPGEQQIYDLAYRQIDYEYDGLDNRIKGDEKERLLSLRRELAKFDSLKPASLPTALAVTDVGPTAPETLIPKKKEVTGPGVLSILDPSEMPIDPAGQASTTGRRAAFAKWLTSQENPLTARVMVNRIWQAHFGRGLAQNASDFGTLGGPPSHPQLLDWLTRRFLDQGWHLKDLHRLIVTSATWKQSSEHLQLADYQLIDPQNRWYWRANVRRLDAEQIRDAILQASGQLNPEAGGPGVQPDVPRRSIYMRVMRNERDSLLDVFDLPLFFNSTSSRDTTTSPVQSLMLFNSQLMLNHATQLAGRVQASPASEPDFGLLWLRVFGRPPTDQELHDAREFLQYQSELVVAEQALQNGSDLPIGRLPHRDGQAILINPQEKPARMNTEAVRTQELREFSLEACFQIRSVHETGTVRTIAANWDGKPSTSGWAFGVTGKASRRKPQTLVLQMFGKTAGGEQKEAALFSDQHVELNTPYFAAFSVKLAKDGVPGEVTFYLKNLANDDDPMQTAVVPHDIAEPLTNDLPLTLGYRQGSAESVFDGLLDDVRWTSRVLADEELLLNRDVALPETLAHWKFEAVPGVLTDSSGHNRHLFMASNDRPSLTPAQTSLVDLCHILLNSSEFLYVK